MTLLPHEFWQVLTEPTPQSNKAHDFRDSYPARLPDGRELLLPIRTLPGAGDRAVASLIINQASFAVEDALAAVLCERLAHFAPEVVIGTPTLGLSLAANVARRLGHSRLVALGTSRKFWYDEDLSEPMTSITSPAHAKKLYVDPRMLPLLEGKRVAVIDDVISSGSSLSAVLRLLGKAHIEPVAIGAAMLQGQNWQKPLAPWQDRIVAAITSPMLHRSANGSWQPLA